MDSANHFQVCRSGDVFLMEIGTEGYRRSLLRDEAMSLAAWITALLTEEEKVEWARLVAEIDPSSATCARPQANHEHKPITKDE